MNNQNTIKPGMTFVEFQVKVMDLFADKVENDNISEGELEYIITVRYKDRIRRWYNRGRTVKQAASYIKR